MSLSNWSRWKGILFHTPLPVRIAGYIPLAEAEANYYKRLRGQAIPACLILPAATKFGDSQP
jgi:hypothetical protein